MKPFLAAALSVVALFAEAPPRIPAPFYTPSSVVNSASLKGGSLAPNTIGTLFGKDLAFVTKSLSQEDIYSGILPTTLLGSGVRLLVNRTLAYIYYVSPTQINFLVPSTLAPGRAEIQLGLDSRYGDPVQITLAEFSPALFQLDPETALAVRFDGSVISSQNPARPGDKVILYANGLGATRPRIPAGQIPTGAATLERINDFQITLDGNPVDRSDIFYAGAAPGFAGLYQINMRLPENAGRNPQIRIAIRDTISPEGVRLPIEPSNP